MVTILPQVQIFLDQVAAMSAGLPKMRDMPLGMARQSYIAMSQLADRPVPDVPWQDSKIAAVGVRVYTPKAARPDQIFIFIHGGGFVIGDLTSHHSLASEIARQLNMCVIAVDYRLAPEHVFPAAHDDVFAVVDAVIHGAHGKMAKILVGGDSAGGNLSAAVAHKYRAAIAGQLLIYPVTDFTAKSGSMLDFANGYILEQGDMDWFINSYIPAHMDKREPRLSPQFGDLQSLPPAVVLTCGLDPLRDQGNIYAEALTGAGNVVVHRQLDGLPHASFQLRGAMPAAQDALTQGLLDLQRIAR
jgi:acetyl esterase